METIEKSINVNVPVRTAYNQWTQFEEFPHFMEGVEEVRQQGDKNTHWRANIGGKSEEWDAAIIEQTPDQRVAWRSTTGAYNAGAVSFQALGANQTRLTLACTNKSSAARPSLKQKWGDLRPTFALSISTVGLSLYVPPAPRGFRPATHPSRRRAPR